MAHADLAVETNHITVQTNWTEKEQIKLIPGAWWGPARGKDPVWFLPLAWASCVMLRGIFHDHLTIGDALNEWAFAERKRRVDPAMAIRTETQAEEILPPSISGMNAYSFQVAGTTFLDVANDALLGDEMGTGKTIQALLALRVMDIADALPAIVICPNSVKKNWEREIAEWFPEATAINITGSAAIRQRLLTGPSTLNPKTITIVNIEAVRSFSRLAPYGGTRLKKCRVCDKTNGEEGLSVARCQVHPKPLNAIPFKTVIVDEAHRIKDPTSQQTRACWAVMHGSSVQRRWGLTGTAMANHPGDLWSIMHGISPTDFPSKSKFVDRYALTGWNAYGGLDIVGLQPETKDEFYKIFDPRFRRMPKALVLDQLPPKVRQRRVVQMSPKQRKAYKEIEDGLVTRLDDGSLIVAPTNLAAQVRLLQFSSSYCTVERNDSLDLSGWTVKLCEPSPKLDELDQIYEDLGVFTDNRPIVVCAESRQLIYLAAARLEKRKLPFGMITGLQKDWERDVALRDFQAGNLPVLLFTVQAGGVGLTMTRADTIVFIQRSWSMINNRQAEDRVHRIGSEIHESVNIIDIVTEDTVEETQLDRLDEKLARLEEINRDRLILTAAGKDTSELDALETRLLAANLGAK